MLEAYYARQAGFTMMRRIPQSELTAHKSRDDAWSAFNGRVYNITPYLKFHPGGVGELMRVAGKDGTELFSALPWTASIHFQMLKFIFKVKTHAWISAENMLDACLIGMLVRD